MIPLQATEHPFLSTFALILLVYICCLGGVLAVRLAVRGHLAYWLSVLGALLFLLGTLWGRGYLSSGVTFAFAAGGIVAAIFGVALDLIFGPPYRADAIG